jgi:hypothetical protein
MRGTVDGSGRGPGPRRWATARSLGVVSATVLTVLTVLMAVAVAPPAGAASPPAPRIVLPPPISKVTTATIDATSLSSRVTSTTTGIAATFVDDLLSVTWGPGTHLTVPGPFTVGSTVNSLTASIGPATDQQCAGPGSLATADIDQLSVGSAGAVRTLSLQFGCIAAVSGDAVSGTVGIDVPPSTRASGYNLVEGDGLVTGFGVGQFLGALGDLVPIHADTAVVGAATTSLDGGLWMAGADGGVFTYGDAGFYGSTGALHLNRPIVGMAATPDGKGYWLVASDGGIFTFGDARFYGSTGALHLNRPIVGMAATPDGRGYWLVASDGGIFAYGDASFYGSTGALHLNRPIVGMAATPDGRGYWLVASDGGIFTFGDAGFHGSTGGIRLDSPIVGMAASADGDGYWMTASDGGVFSFGDAPFSGSLGGSGVDDLVAIAR